MKGRCIFDTEIRATGSSIVGTIFYDSLSENLGGFRERLLPGCFSASLQNDNVVGLWQHQHDKPLASTAAGTMTFKDSPKCLEITMRLDPTITFHRDALECVRRKDATGLSFSFKVKKGGERWTSDAAGEKIRELSALTTREFSVVTFPAYPKSHATVRKQTNDTFTYRRNTSMTRLEMLEERKRCLDRMRQLDEQAETTESRSEYQRLDEAFEKLSADIEKVDRREKLEARELLMKQSRRPPIKPNPRPENGQEQREGSQYRDDRQSYEAPENGYKSEFLRALSMDGSDGGSYLVLPTQMASSVIVDIEDELPIMKMCDTIKVPKAHNVSYPALDNEPSDPTWVSELSTGDEDDSLNFDARSLSPHPLAMRIRISRKLMDASAFDVDAIIRKRLAYRAGIVIENSILNGSGANQFLGVFTNSPHGLSTACDCSTDNTATQLKADGLINAQHTLRPAYWKNAAWAFHPDALKQIRKLKDGEGNFLFVPGLTEGAASTLLGMKILLSQYCPNIFTSGQYVGILGDWSTYKIAIAKEFEVQVLKELYAVSNQYGMIVRMEADGMPSLVSGFVRVKLG
jgi:HK97 family phage major capsid protein/HK97 family phage prohead protease